MIDRFLYWGNHLEAKSGKIKDSDLGGSGGWRNGHPPKPPIVPYLSAFITQALKPQYTCFFSKGSRDVITFRCCKQC